MRALVLAAVAALAACASAPMAGQVEQVGPDAEVAAAQARARALPACHAVTADAFAAAPGWKGTSTMGDFQLEMTAAPDAEGNGNQSLGCAGIGDDNVCTLHGDAWVKASVPGQTRWWHVPAGTKAEILSSRTSVTCGVLPAGAA